MRKIPVVKKNGEDFDDDIELISIESIRHTYSYEYKKYKLNVYVLVTDDGIEYACPFKSEHWKHAFLSMPDFAIYDRGNLVNISKISDVDSKALRVSFEEKDGSMTYLEVVRSRMKDIKEKFLEIKMSMFKRKSGK